MTTGTEADEGFFRNQRIAMRGRATDASTGTCSSNAVTINDLMGIITTESLSTAHGAAQAITMTNSRAAAGDLVFAQVVGGSYTTGIPVIGACVPTTGQVVFSLANVDASAALNGTVIFAYEIVKAL